MCSATVRRVCCAGLVLLRARYHQCVGFAHDSYSFLHNNAKHRAGGCAGECYTAAVACTATVQLSKLLVAIGGSSWTGASVVHIAKRRGLQSILQLLCMKVAAAFVRVASRGKILQLSCNGVFGTVAVWTDLASALI